MVTKALSKILSSYEVVIFPSGEATHMGSECTIHHAGYTVKSGKAPSSAIVSDGSRGVLLFGEAFNWKEPYFDMADICNEIFSITDREYHELDLLDSLSGRFLIIVLCKDGLEIIPDATGGYEFYHNDAFTHFASSYSLINRMIKGEQWPVKASHPYQHIQDSSAIGIFDTTRKKNIKRLLPNHKISTQEKCIKRFFPCEQHKIQRKSFVDVSDFSEKILSGLAKSVSNRHAIFLPVTAGYDSRLLMAMFHKYNPEYYILKHPDMGDLHHDLKMARRICEKKGAFLNVVNYSSQVDETELDLRDDLSQLRLSKRAYCINGLKPLDTGQIFLNGNTGEIGRSYFGKSKKNSAKLLAALSGYEENLFAIEQAGKWLNSFNHQLIDEGKILDFFYWEVRMGTWGAKALAETNMVVNMVSPMNNHLLFRLWLSLDPMYRKYYRNELFLNLIARFDNDLAQFPINPNYKTRFIKLLIDLNLYAHYKAYQNSKKS